MLPCLSYKYGKALDRQEQTTGYAKNRQAEDLQPVDTLIIGRVLLSDPTTFRMWSLDFEAGRKIPEKTYLYPGSRHIQIIYTQNSSG